MAEPASATDSSGTLPATVDAQLDTELDSSIDSTANDAADAPINDDGQPAITSDGDPSTSADPESEADATTDPAVDGDATSLSDDDADPDAEGPSVEDAFVTALPTILGTPKVGTTLTANVGVWTPTPTSFSYQWQRDGIAIAGATASTYRLVAADANHAISVVVTGSKDGYVAASATSTATPTVSLATLAGATPKITGTVKAGYTLTATIGTWADKPTLKYQWLRGTTPIAGATKTTYKLTTADVGKTITLRVTATKSGYATATKTASVKWALTAPTPKITGSTVVASTLTATPGTWTTGTTLKYQWYRDGKPLSGATTAKYKLVPGDAGKQITVKVTGSKTSYNSKSKTSAKTVAIKKATLKTAVPKLSGSTTVASTLTATPGTWTTGATLKYQWYRDGKPISGATSSKYKLVPADAGKQISVKVTGTKSGYNSASKTSVKTGAIKKATLKTATPKITGTTMTGSTLKASPGTWTASTTFKYQWYRDGKPISGATSSAYKLVSADAGKQISVKVTGSKSGYNSASKTSAKTGAIKKLISGAVTPGAFCKKADAGSYGKSKTGLLMKCTTSKTDTRLRWRQA